VLFLEIIVNIIRNDFVQMMENRRDWRKQMNSFDLIIKHDLEEEDVAVILVNGFIDDKSYQFLFDTGANTTRVRNDDYIQTGEILPQYASSPVHI
jgi:hypothetical protein